MREVKRETKRRKATGIRMFVIGDDGEAGIVCEMLDGGWFWRFLGYRARALGLRKDQTGRLVWVPDPPRKRGRRTR